jgi:hypothetical protein
MTKRDFQAKEYAIDKLKIMKNQFFEFLQEVSQLEYEAAMREYKENKQATWPEPPQENLFDDTAISAKYLEQIALSMFNQNIRGASYVEDIAYQLDSLGADYARVVEQRDAAIRKWDESVAFWKGELRSRTAERDASRARVAELEAK